MLKAGMTAVERALGEMVQACLAPAQGGERSVPYLLTDAVLLKV